MDAQFTDKFVAFVDILGFKNMVEVSERGAGLSTKELIDLQMDLGQPSERNEFERYGPIVCPESPFTRRDLDFRLTQVSDSVVISCEVSPVALLNMVFHCSKIVMKLLRKGVMCRGYVTRGLLLHTESVFIGSAFHHAYEKEKQVVAFRQDADERGTPFIEVDQLLCSYIADSGDQCIKMMFGRIVKSDGNVTAVFPFQGLERTVAFDKHYNREKDRDENRAFQMSLETLKTKVSASIDSSNTDAIRKSQHYLNALEKQIQVCRDVEAQIDRLNEVFPRRYPV